MVVEAWKTALKSNNKLRLILVPRHPSRVGKLTESLDSIGVPWIFRSSIDETAITPHSSHEARTLRSGNAPAVLIVDVIGELSSWWALAGSGFVGGSMGSRGGQKHD